MTKAPSKSPHRTTQQQKNLRKYLSKSREALFERVIQQQQQHQKNSLRKTTLLSQYHKTRRLCESQMSLVSKSRERLLMMDQHQMSPYFSRSREKLYGLRSLSKSHEVLDLCKSAAANGSQSQEGVGLGILRTLTRATTADLSMIPLLRQKLLGHGSSTTSITSSMTTDQDLDEPIVPPSPSEPKLNRMQSSSNSVVQSPITNTTIEEIFENSSQESLSTIKPEAITQVPALLSPKLLKETLRNQSKFGMFTTEDTTTSEVINELEDASMPTATEEVIETESCTEITDIEPVNVKDYTSSNETLIAQGSDHETADKDENRNEVTGEDDSETVRKFNQKNVEYSSCIQSETSTSDVPDKIDTNNEEQENSGVTEMKNDDEEESPEEEPRYTVAQLVSAFNRHQEVVTKSSLEATKIVNDKENPVSQISTFPIGPNALRLFIPDIDITNEPPKRKQKRKYNIGIKYPSESNEHDDVLKETAESLKEMYYTEDDESFQSLESTSSLTGDCDSLTNLSIPEDTTIEEENKSTEVTKEDNVYKDNQTGEESTNENVDSTNNNWNEDTNLTLVVEPPRTGNTKDDENCQPKQNSNKFQLSVDVIPNYLRSGSLSSDTSTMSWEELTPTPSTNKEEPQQWIPGPRSRSPSAHREPWGRLCTGTYNRAMEKFNSKANKQENPAPNRRPSRKSLTLLSPPQVVNPSEKVRRKSIPVIKQYS